MRNAVQPVAARHSATALAAFAFVALAGGGLVYLLWRPTNLLLFRWVESLGWMEEIEFARTLATGAEVRGWLLHSFPHGAWTFSGTVLFALLWRGRPGWSARFWIGTIPTFSLFGELGQLAGLVPGRFDFLDLLTSLAAIALALVLTSPHARTPAI